MLTFLLGMMAVAGDLQLTIACAVSMTVLLALREPLHRWVDSLSWQEIRAVLTLLAMSFLLLPLLPTTDRSVENDQSLSGMAFRDHDRGEFHSPVTWR
jgi:uncharacterized membrane protein (DUF4010 family)